jgi:hypothetical protein
MVPSTVAVVPCATSSAGAKHNVYITKQKTALSPAIRDRLFIQLPFDLIRLTSSPVKIVATQIQPISAIPGDIGDYIIAGISGSQLADSIR